MSLADLHSEMWVYSSGPRPKYKSFSAFAFFYIILKSSELNSSGFLGTKLPFSISFLEMSGPFWIIISLNVVYYAVLPPTIMLTIKVWRPSHKLTLKHSLWCTHHLGSLRVLDLKWEPALIPLDRIESTQTQEGVNCVGKFSWLSGSRLKNCLVRVFAVYLEMKCSGYKQKK